MGMAVNYHMSKQLQESGTYVAKYTVMDGYDGKFIYHNGFNAVPSLKKVIIPEGVNALEGLSFVECPKLTEIVIPKSVKIIEGLGNDGVFYGCTSLEKIVFLGNPMEINYSNQQIGSALLFLFSNHFDIDNQTITFIENAYGYCPSEYVNACNTAINEFIAQVQQSGTVQLVNLKENFFKPLNEA